MFLRFDETNDEINGNDELSKRNKCIYVYTYIQRTTVREQETRKLSSENVCLIPSSIFVSPMNASQRHCSRSSLPMLLHKIVYSALDRTFLLRIHHYFASRKNSWFGKYFITHCVSGQCAESLKQNAKGEQWISQKISENEHNETKEVNWCILIKTEFVWYRLAGIATWHGVFVVGKYFVFLNLT